MGERSLTARVPRCNAAYKTKKDEIKYCRKAAGRGTAHVGEGPCLDHDLMCTAVANYDRRQSVPEAFQERREYTLKMEGPLAEKIRALGGDTVHFNPEGRVADLTFEIVAGKALLAQLIEDYDPTCEALLEWSRAFKAGEIATEPPNRTLTMSELEKMLFTSARVVALARTVQDLVPLKTVAGVFNAMYEIMEREITDSDVRVKLQQEFQRVTNVFRSPEQVQRVRPATSLAPGKRKAHANISGGGLR